ncbi:PREDICTED: transmembrane protein 79-like, partial [Mesitornis unicolor]|uniref:transmembrane protein 79-like n=1 Tax=Mesitornis unicolor TaxID=54374 RepID=UPI0005292FDE
MAAADPILPPEEVALLEMGKVTVATPLDKVPPALDEHPGDPDATLPWDHRQHSAQPELAHTKRRSSPEGEDEDPEEASLTGPPVEAEDKEAPELPVMVTHAFVPIDPQCIERTPGKQKPQPSPWPREEGKGPASAGTQCPCARDCGSANLKAVASLVGALLLCPCFLYGAYVFLPFDAPLLPTISARLIYTLRCAAFATFPIVL